MTVHERPVGGSVDWFTPPSLFERLEATFDLDPCAGSSPADLVNVNRVPARYKWTTATDGLAHRWVGSVWLNPPYGPRGVAFVERMIEHRLGLLLLPARTETRIFQRAALAADAVCFLRDRIHFIRRDGTNGRASFGSVLFAFGETWRQTLARADLGWQVAGGGRDLALEEALAPVYGEVAA